MRSICGWREPFLIPFERYADDVICHCKSADEAQALWSALADHFAACELVLHPEKTKMVYCKDANRRGDFPNQSFDFLGFSFRARKTVWQGTIHAHGFMPAVSPKALKAISRTIRRWTLHHHSDKSLQDLAKAYNPYTQGWINYYGPFHRTQLRPTLKRIDAFVIPWARRKFKRLRRKTKGARDWFERLCRANPTLLAHWLSIGPLIARCCQAAILCLQWHDGSDHFVGAGRGCGDGVIAGDERIVSRNWPEARPL
ncbi:MULTISPECIES: group II intron maturase-specific domain-containing protein [unclassified Bradyrhizobium]|uniref:group II intron maturase-specific domain-containing protein n=1 Tax=unclassified Bradyrhizobium TaxID=2631580 RepID=UPI001FDFE55F|nr:MULTISPECIES: group II intron maturase-specific domain-containing protein [unclassified Bradyrhizobium]